MKQNRSDLKAYIPFEKYKDTVRTKKQMGVSVEKIGNKKVKSFDDLIPDSLKTLVDDQALNSVANVKSLLEINTNQYKNQLSDIMQHKVEWHKKLSLSVACIVLFFIGAPLGSIIRKGGLGLPLVVALIFFLIFYLLNIFGEKFTKDEVLDPIIGMWLPIIVLSPVGFFLTYKAMHDSQLFNKEYYYRAIKKIISWSKNLLLMAKDKGNKSL